MRVNDSTPSEPTPEEGERTSRAENAKNLIKKHKGKFLAVGGAIATVAAAVVVAGLVGGSGTGETEDAGDTDGTEDLRDSESAADLGDADRPKRKSPVGHDVVAALVKLADGWQASEERRAAYKEATGEDLPADSTYRSEHRRGDFGDEEDPGDAVA
ncbi:hypothetical protein GCM10009663_22250 [Kitasatospora arboriphila]|uniref:Uncharacterized protein n=1 Tax=Kitasatospora arboriphila TaxID=258052 RepID=A0ABN1TEY0_9ACTN